MLNIILGKRMLSLGRGLTKPRGVRILVQFIEVQLQQHPQSGLADPEEEGSGRFAAGAARPRPRARRRIRRARHGPNCRARRSHRCGEREGQATLPPSGRRVVNHTSARQPSNPRRVQNTESQTGPTRPLLPHFTKQLWFDDPKTYNPAAQHRFRRRIVDCTTRRPAHSFDQRSSPCPPRSLPTSDTACCHPSRH